MQKKLFAFLVLLLAVAGPSCGPSDKDYTPPPPSENVDSPPPGGMEENPGQPRP